MQFNKNNKLKTILFQMLCDRCNEEECEVEELAIQYGIDNKTIEEYKD